MKKYLTRLLTLMLIFIVAFSFVACGDKIETKAEVKEEAAVEIPKSAENIKLSVWINAFVTDVDLKKPKEEWMAAKMFKKFEEENPGVTIEFTVPPDQQAAHQTFKAAAMAQSGPDIANLWSGQPLFALRDVVLKLNGKISPEDLENIGGWKTVTDGFKADGDILGFPAAGTEVTGFLYNKKIIADAGLDLENNPPKTVEEFMAALEKIKTMGILPIAADAGGSNGLFIFGTASWWVQMVGNDRVASNSTGETKFIDDKYFIDTLKATSELYKKGYVNKDYATSKEAGNKFMQGTAALLATGNWSISSAVEALGVENVGFYNVPDFAAGAKVSNTTIGGPGHCLCIANYTKYPDMAIKLVSFMSNKENHTNLVKEASRIPLRKDISLEELGWKGKQVYEKAYKLGQNYVYWSENSMIPDVMNEYLKVGITVITGKTTPEDAAKQLDRKAEEVN